ncbi:MAG: 23S rRNA (adenine(2030)-N(6))-methyltransferase RlmJ [Myxococcota bacterium]
MLAYRHGYHAANHADVLKHSVWLYVLEYMKRKEKPFLVVDTHAGPADYDLESDFARKNEEHREGLERVLHADAPPAPIARYLEAIAAHRQRYGATRYPGSFALTLAARRAQDRAVAFELHPSDFAALGDFCRGHRNVAKLQDDGLKGLLAHVPPVERRAAVIIDPSYEIKTDYQRVPQALRKACRKFPSGTYVLWYPVVERAVTESMLSELRSVRNVLRLELAVAPDSKAPGMTASGLAIVNPPFTLAQDGETIVGWLAQSLGAKPRVEWWSPE